MTASHTMPALITIPPEGGGSHRRRGRGQSRRTKESRVATVAAPEGTADRDCFAALREGLSGSAVAVVELANHLNDPPFGEAMADRLHQMITEGERDGAR